jgi:hypothetical protein
MLHNVRTTVWQFNKAEYRKVRVVIVWELDINQKSMNASEFAKIHRDILKSF